MSDRSPADAQFFDEAGRPRRKVLIADDAPMFREIETVFLGRTAQIVTACDGDEALVVAEREHPDLVVTDMKMRNVDGDVLCRNLRAHAELSRVPVVIVTSGRSEEHERAVRAGADDVVEKPLDRVMLLQAVKRLLRKTIRGLPRVALETDVRVHAGASEGWARSRNISRGGMFIEADGALEPAPEFDLEFCVPETDHWIRSTARVAWRRPQDDSGRLGLGLQFLKIDRDASRWLDEYVYEMTPPQNESAPTPRSP